MARVIRFAPQLGDWLAQNLDRGLATTALVETMRTQGMETRAAEAIVAATVDARRRGAPPPLDHIELRDEAPATPVARLPTGTRIAAGDREIVVHMRSDDPVCATLGNVLDGDECRALIEMARPRLAPSTLVDPATGHNAVSDKRSSWGMFFRLAENDFIARIDRRVSLLMNLPFENGEGLQVLHYPTGAGSEPHFDYLQPSNAVNRESLLRRRPARQHPGDLSQRCSGRRPDDLSGARLGRVAVARQCRLLRIRRRSRSGRRAFAARQRTRHQGREVGRDEMDALAAVRLCVAERRGPRAQGASNFFARATTLSTVKPYCSSSTSAGADAPKRSTMPSMSPWSPT